MKAPQTALIAEVRDRWIATSSLLLGMVSYTIAISMGNIILPQIMTSLRVDLDQAQWVLTAFGIAQTVAMPMVGWLTSLVGHRTLYLGSLSLMCIGAILSGSAWSIESLITFRIVKGAGIGLMQPIIMAMLYQIFPPQQRGLALGLSMIGWAIGPAIGPLVGGYLVEVFNWRAAFYVSVPMGVAGLASAFWFLPALPKPPRKTMDQLGLLTMTIALVTLLIGVSQGRREGWNSSYILTLFTIGGMTLLLFFIIEWRSASPLVDLRLFRSLPFTLGCLVVCISTVAFRGTALLSIVFLQQILHFIPLDVGWIMLPGNIVFGMTVLLAGRLADKTNPKILVLIGLGMFSISFFWFARINEMVSLDALIFFLALRFAAFGVMGSPNNLSTMRGLPEEQVVMGSGILSLVRSISGTTGTALAAIIYEHQYLYHIKQYAYNSAMHLAGFQEMTTQVYDMLRWSGEVPALLVTQTRFVLQQRLLTEATMAAYQDYFLFAAFVGVLAMIAALPYEELFGLIRTSLRKVVQKKEDPEEEKAERSSDPAT